MRVLKRCEGLCVMRTASHHPLCVPIPLTSPSFFPGPQTAPLVPLHCPLAQLSSGILSPFLLLFGLDNSVPPLGEAHAQSALPPSVPAARAARAWRESVALRLEGTGRALNFSVEH